LDNLTHTLTGLALSQAGLNRKTRFATLALVLGANLPDADMLTRIAGTAEFLKYHRGITHSILGVTVLAVLLAGVIYYFGRRALPRRSAPPLNRRWLLGICLIATSSNPLLDFTNSYGVRPFLPFSGRWYAWDIMYILDPLLLLLLTLGLGLSLLLRLISEEVGARKPTFRGGAIFALCSLVLLWGIRDLAHRRALGMLDGHTYAGEEPRRIGAFPAPANPFQWTGVVETDSAYHVLPVRATADDVDAERTRVFRKAESSPALAAAMKTRPASIFLDFARFPWAQALETEDGFRVTFQDLRYVSLESDRRRFLVEVELDKDLRVRSESLTLSGGLRQRDAQPRSEEEEPGTSVADASAGRRASLRRSTVMPTTSPTATSKAQTRCSLRYASACTP
jgi:inner membrane protein